MVARQARREGAEHPGQRSFLVSLPSARRLQISDSDAASVGSRDGEGR